MFSSEVLLIVGALAGAWFLQLLLSVRQMKEFNDHRRAMTKYAPYVSVGVAGSTYRRRLYTVIAVDENGVIQGAEKLSGFTVLASPKPIPAALGLTIDEVGQGDPPPGLNEKTWKSLDHAAGFIRPKLSEEADVSE